LELLKNWFKRYLSDPQVVILGVVLLMGLFIVIGLGKWLAPNPQLMSDEQVQAMTTAISQELGVAGQHLLSWSLASLPS